MNFIVPGLLFAVLTAAASLHLYWARGGLWPGQDEDGLIAIVVGDATFDHMPPPGLTRIVAGGLILAACTAIALAFEVNALVDTVLAYVGAGFAAVFLLRGLIGYLPAWRRGHAVEPFATLDRLIYSPACILIGEGFFSLVSSRF
jgi:hypothetical protein